MALTLTRKRGEKIVLPGLGIEIQVGKLTGSRVSLSIDAPKEIQIQRGEHAQKDGPPREEPSGDPEKR